MKKILLFFGILTAVLAVHAQEYAVIVNKGSAVSQASASELKRLYTGKADKVGGASVQPVNLALDNPVSAKFIQTVAGMNIVDYKSFLMAQQIRGGAAAPKVLKTDDAVIAFVSENPDAIGYIDKAKVSDAVKEVPVK